MNRSSRWPGKSMFLADLVSIGAGFAVFRALCTQWEPETFARWEWLRIVLGLCLLLPRNGFEVLALRCAVRHPNHVREWTSLNLIMRLPLAILAMLVFLGTASRLGGESAWLPFMMALTLPFQSCVPDLATRVQGRFVVVTILQMFRNVLPAIVLLSIPVEVATPLRMAQILLATETVVFLLWWFDASRHGGLPGGSWRRMLRRGSGAMARRSIDQTISRFLRVLSWNVDAVMLGALSPEAWARFAPARALLMTAVVPVANYLGAVSPLLARENPEALRNRFLRTSCLAVGLGASAVWLSAIFGAEIAVICFGPETPVDRAVLVTNAARSGPLLILLLATTCWTSLRIDERTRALALVHFLTIAGICSIVILGVPPQTALNAFVLMEWALAMCCVFELRGSRFTSSFSFRQLRCAAYAGRERKAVWRSLKQAYAGPLGRIDHDA